MFTLKNMKSFKSVKLLFPFLIPAAFFGNCGTTSDQPPPETTLSSTPTNPSNSSDATFTFECDQGDCAFECQLDSDQWSPCSSPLVYTGLANGSHSFKIRAVGANQIPDPTPIPYVWTIVTNVADTTPPDTILNTTPSDPSNSPEATLTFSCDGGFCTFECRIDSGAWATCDKQRTYQNLSAGPHQFSVRATDAAGNVDLSPATYSWTIV